MFVITSSSLQTGAVFSDFQSEMKCTYQYVCLPICEKSNVKLKFSFKNKSVF